MNGGNGEGDARMSGTPDADAQDTEFGRQAKEKEERLDESLDRGEGQPAEPAGEGPRAGGKADPPGE
jgi:hypothetical protein